MTVYADILIAENIIINGIMLLSVNLLCHAGGKRARIAASAVFGGFYSCVIFLRVPPAVSVLLKIIPVFIMTGMAFGFVRLFLFLRRSAVLFAVTSFTGGIIYLFAVNVYPEGVAVGGGQIYIYITPTVLIVSVFLIFVLMSILSRVPPVGGKISRIGISYKGKSTALTAFSDTGNTLYEPISALPVAVCKASCVRDILPKGEVPWRVVEYSTIQGRGMLKAFRPDCVWEETGKGRKVLSPMYIALSDGDTGKWDLILPGNCIKE